MDIVVNSAISSDFHQTFQRLSQTRLYLPFQDSQGTSGQVFVALPFFLLPLAFQLAKIFQLRQSCNLSLQVRCVVH